MNMTRVEIENFQSHDNTKFDLGSGINAFVGTSDSGKSAILRAMKWNLTNSPAGAEFIKEGTSEAAVTIHFEDGHSVERRRNKGGSKNIYILRKDGVIVEEYTGFGNKVPPGILEVTRINPDFPFNFANQLEAPFLLSETPKVRAETIGNLEELGRIDQALSKTNEDIRDLKRDEKSDQKRLKLIEAERSELLKELSVSRVKAETIERLKGLIVEKQRIHTALESSTGRITQLNNSIQDTRVEVDRANRILDAWKESFVEEARDFKRLEQIITRLLGLKDEASRIHFMNEDKLNRLIDLSASANELVSDYREFLAIRKRIEQVDTERNTMKNTHSERIAALAIDDIDQEVVRFRELFKRNKRLSEITKSKKDLDAQVETASLEIDKLLTQFVDALHEAKTCPVCLQQTDNIEEHQIAHSI